MSDIVDYSTHLQPATKKRKLEERPPLERKGDGMFTVTVGKLKLAYSETGCCLKMISFSTGPKLPAHFSGIVPCNPVSFCCYGAVSTV